MNLDADSDRDTEAVSDSDFDAPRWVIVSVLVVVALVLWSRERVMVSDLKLVIDSEMVARVRDFFVKVTTRDAEAVSLRLSVRLSL
jgi:hypothetical protein